MAHIPVLLKEVIQFFCQNHSINHDPLYADLTFGDGGHSFGILQDISNAKILALDQDPRAVEDGQKKIREHHLEKRIQLVKGNFAQFSQHFCEFTLVKEKLFDGILLDLGVSSRQIDDASRGFSFRQDAPLDMRMDNSDNMKKTALFIVNNYHQMELERVLVDYGEEKFAKRIARHLVEKRAKQPIETTGRLAKIIRELYPKKLQYGRIDPATRTFQALRIEVNDELTELRNALICLPPLLKIGGKLQTISFHSLEDRIVKHKFKELEKREDMFFIIKTKRPLIPLNKEILHNSRSRSAKLRVIQKVYQRPRKKKY